MEPRPEFKPLYEVCEGVGRQATVLFAADGADEAIDWARAHFRETGDSRVVVRHDEFQPDSGLFRARIVWRARQALADPGPRREQVSPLTGRTLCDARAPRR
jgi:hypothetical protein